MLTMGLTTYTLEVVTVYDALETLTLRGTDNINELHVLCDDISYCKGVAEFKLSCEVSLELNELLLRSGSCLFKMALKSRGGLLFFLFVIGKLYSDITIFFYCTNLCDNARTSLNNGAWYILTISTENGSHSDFLSN